MSDDQHFGHVVVMRIENDWLIPDVVGDTFVSGEMPKFLSSYARIGESRTNFYYLIREFGAPNPTASKFLIHGLATPCKISDVALHVPEGQEPNSHITDSRGRKFYRRELVRLSDGSQLAGVYIPEDFIQEYATKCALPRAVQGKNSE
ncbi:MAG: hypothetical protein HY514_02835 [Candidatus Aenigmarchaeota archaeon]|nr:hypothetical protein [Candidatus Aenigmarchaeota archaeon]